MNDDDPGAELDALRAEHRQLDEQIAALSAEGASDQLEIALAGGEVNWWLVGGSPTSSPKSVSSWHKPPRVCVSWGDKWSEASV